MEDRREAVFLFVVVQESAFGPKADEVDGSRSRHLGARV
jgi:hypothetical protein